jgi:hypothetical protein
LLRDIRKAPGLKNKLLYLVMPPGWSHTGDHKTARVIREEFLESTKDRPLNGDTRLEEEIMEKLL